MSETLAETRSTSRPWVLCALLLLVGAWLAFGGLYLIVKGGSPYYLLAGGMLVMAASWLWRGDRRAGWAYIIFIVVTIAWALFEAGLDGWALAPRLFIPAGLGIWLAMPWVGAWLGGGQQHDTDWIASRGCAVGAGVAVALVFIAALWPSGTKPGSFPDPLPTPVTASLIGPESGEWLVYGNTLAGTRFSPLSQLNTENVHQLEPAWTYRTGVESTYPMQATPLMVEDTLYLCTQTNIVIALDPETGKERWRFDPEVDATGASVVTTCRGVAYVKADHAPDCPRRIIAATFDTRLLALDARTGELCASFGEQGTVDLKLGMGKVDPGFYYVSSPPVVVNNRIVLGGWIADNVYVGEPSGVIRAFDAITGEFAWAWDLGRPGEHGEPAPDESYTRGTPNSWAPMSGDEQLGLVYVPMGNATPDHWGGHRSPESDQYSSSVVALDVGTGEPRWSFQTVHHDVWDYDVASQPTLVDVMLAGERVPALVQPTKQGQVFMLDRRNGELLADVEERPVSHDAPPGDWLSPTQPFSTEMPIFSGPELREQDMWGVTPFDQLWCRIHFRSLRYEGTFTPVGSDFTTLIYPGAGGGMNWGGASVDPEHGVMVVNTMHVGTRLRLLPRQELAGEVQEADGYHLSGPPMEGTPYALYWDTFISPLGIPCNEPPYGMISAVDLSSKQLLWSQPLGTTQDSGPVGLRFRLPMKMGVPNFGGSITTRGGLVFIGATHERALRALDIRSGTILWKTRLKAGGQATPMTYLSPRSGRQFIVTVAAGHRTLQSPLGDYVQAFAISSKN